MRTVSDSLAAKITAQFIAENPIIVAVTRRTKTATAAGGHTWSNPVVQAPQTLRKIPTGLSFGQKSVVTNSDGKEVVPSWLLVGPIDANLMRSDIFVIDLAQYEILNVGRKPLMGRTIAEIVEYGR